MTNKWLLNGTELGDSNTKVIIVAHDESTDNLTSNVFIHGFGETSEALGELQGRIKFKFALIGRNVTRSDTWASLITGTLNAKTPWSLEMPSELNWAMKLHYRKLLFITEGEVQVKVASHSRLEVSVTGIITGYPDVDGRIEQCFGVEVTWSENDFYATSGDIAQGALIGVAEQASGYITAQNISTGLHESIALSWTLTASTPSGGTDTVEVYELTSAYISGSPLSEGETGLSEVCIKNA